MKRSSRFYYTSYTKYIVSLPKTTGLALPLEKAEDVSLADGSLDVTDDGTSAHSAGIVHELNADLGDVTGVAGSAEDAVNLRELDWLILFGCRKGGVE